MTSACNWQYARNDLIAQTKDHNDPYSWGCYDHQGNMMGGINDMDGYCKSQGYSTASLAGKKTADDWKCQQKIDLTQGCIMRYNRPDAKARKNDGDVWYCYGLF
jgi:hypothetical protein